jgi:hypothetical protein
VKIPVRYDPVTWTKHLLGIELFAWQAQFLRAQAAALLNPATTDTGSTVVACCGRQAGKTTVDAVSLLWYASVFAESAQFVVTPIAPQSKLIWQECGELLRGSVLEQTYAVEVKQADYPSIAITVDGAPSHIDFRSVGLNPGQLRGPHANRIFGDEAARIAGDVFQSDLVPMMSAQQHRQLVMTSTPLFQGDYFHSQWLRGQDPAEGHVQSFQYPSTANPRISRELLESYRKGMSEEAFAVEFLAEWVDGAGSFFPWALIQLAIDPSIEPGPVPGKQYAIGYDQARKRDRSGVAVLECPITETVGEPCRIVEVLDVAPHHEQWPVQAARVAAIARRYGRAPVMLDATHNPAMADLLQQEGTDVHEYRFTSSPMQKAGLYDRFKAALEQGNLFLPAHEDLERELRFIRREVSERSGRVSLGAPERAGHYDDLTTACCLAVELGREVAELGDGLPFGWLRKDPDFRTRAQASEEEADKPRSETDEERSQRRMAAYYGVPDVGTVSAPTQEQAPEPQAETQMERARRQMLEWVIGDERRWMSTRWE